MLRILTFTLVKFGFLKPIAYIVEILDAEIADSVTVIKTEFVGEELVFETEAFDYFVEIDKC